MPLLDRDTFLGASKLRTRDVTVPDLGTVRVREPRDAEWQEFDDDLPGRAVRLVCQFAIDEKGKRLFRDEDVSKLAALGTSKIQPVAIAILDLAGLTRRAVEEAAKNSPTIPSDGSATA